MSHKRRHTVVAAAKSQADTAGVRAVCIFICRDGSGTIDLEEAWVGISKYWPQLDQKSYRTAFAVADRSGDGAIDGDEFALLCRCLKYMDQHRHLIRDIAQQFVETGLTHDDFHVTTNILGIKLTDVEASAWFLAAWNQCNEN
eukprot:COSAG05_NODE_7792_length_769_cov_1.734328_1_plen_142_part_10